MCWAESSSSWWILVWTRWKQSYPQGVYILEEHTSKTTTTRNKTVKTILCLAVPRLRIKQSQRGSWGWIFADALKLHMAQPLAWGVQVNKGVQAFQQYGALSHVVLPAGCREVTGRGVQTILTFVVMCVRQRRKTQKYFWEGVDNGLGFWGLIRPG